MLAELEVSPTRVASASFATAAILPSSAPDPGGVVGAGGDDARAVRAEGGGGDAVAMLEGISEGLAGARVPDPGGVVVAGGDDARAVWAERGGGDRRDARA
jgi:hypothetical protein